MNKEKNDTPKKNQNIQTPRSKTIASPPLLEETYSAKSDTDNRRRLSPGTQQEMLVASETRYRRLFETAKDGILILDAESGNIEDVNPFLIEMLGYSHENFIGKQIWDLGPFKDIIPNKDNFVELQQKGYIRYEDMPLETASGKRIQVEFVSNVYKVNHKNVIQCNIRDITARKQAEKSVKSQLEELQRWQDIMLGREDRVLELKHEVNELCRRLGEPARYSCQEDGSADSDNARKKT